MASTALWLEYTRHSMAQSLYRGLPAYVSCSELSTHWPSLISELLPAWELHMGVPWCSSCLPLRDVCLGTPPRKPCMIAAA